MVIACVLEIGHFTGFQHAYYKIRTVESLAKKPIPRHGHCAGSSWGVQIKFGHFTAGTHIVHAAHDGSGFQKVLHPEDNDRIALQLLLNHQHTAVLWHVG
jgi:hypothetical protein